MAIAQRLMQPPHQLRASGRVRREMDTATAVATASPTAGSATIAPAVSTQEVANTSPAASATGAAPLAPAVSNAEAATTAPAVSTPDFGVGLASDLATGASFRFRCCSLVF